MEQKIRSELLKMTLIMVVLIGLGIYAHEFVISGIKAKAALNLSIFAVFALAAALAFKHVLGLKNEVQALNALKVDYGQRSRRPLDPYRQPAIVFHEPELLGQGYRMITEELGKQDSLHLSNHTVQMLLHDVDQRINDRKSTIMYFSGLMVFLGLLGAFMGLMKTVGSVGDLIGGMDVTGGGGSDGFGKLIEGMKGPLNGMSVGFSSSLFGLMTSMVLGALERFMTSAMKSLRNEFEHWLSNIAELEGGSEAAGGAVAGIDSVARALELGSRQLGELRRVVEGGSKLTDDAQRSIAGIAAGVSELGAAVGRLADPKPLFQPLAEVVENLARNQNAMLDHFETLFAMAERDRAAIRAMLEAMDERAVRERAVDAGELHGQLDRLVALQSAIVEREPVTVVAPPSFFAAQREGLVTRVRRSLFARGAPGAPDAEAAKLRAEVRALAQGQERLVRRVETTVAETLDRIDSRSRLDAALDQQIAAEGNPVELRGARAEMEMLRRGLGAVVQDTPEPPAEQGPAAKRAGGQ